MPSDTYYMMEDIEESTARDFLRFLGDVPDNGSVKIQMLSHGGLVFAGLGICQMIAQAQQRGVTFTVNVYGIAASAASDIILACDKIYMAEGSQILVHSSWGGTDEGISIANQEQLALIRKRLPDYTEKDLENDVWFSADKAVEIGLADGFIEKDSESKAVYRLAAFLTHNVEDKKMANKVKAAEEIFEEKKEEEIEKKEAASICKFTTTVYANSSPIATLRSAATYPTHENCNVIESCFGNDNSKYPFSLVIVPDAVSFICTVANSTARFSSLRT